LNILYYTPYLNQELGGTRQYAVTLLKILAEDTQNKYFILHNSNDPEIFDILKLSNSITLIPSKIGKEKKIEQFLHNIIKLYNYVIRVNKSRSKLIHWSYLNRICNKYKIDIVYSPFQIAPLSNRKTIWTLHDVQEIHFPEYFTSEVREARARGHNDSLARGSHIVVSYEHIKIDLLKYFNINESDISVCLLEMNKLWFDKYTEVDVDKCFIDNLTSKKYLLYAANTWQHKNHIGIIEALYKLKESTSNDIMIYCTGNKTEYYHDTLKPLIDTLGLSNNIIFLGLVSEKELYSLYIKAHGVVIPTKYEAGSFPLYESVLLGIPVICSSVTSLPEVITDSDFLFNPHDYNEIANKIQQLWNNTEFRDKNYEHIENAKEKIISHKSLNSILNVLNKIRNVE
jgi:glycosyltransferase involved in cell wall biosynthesis